ncbi:oocyte zinc finger protein XlCOF6-like [Cynoglossus semilaevis]|uniref:oocyte zinc finger protein XlCOF6-like n=1 Tax=Cynoglossus semilaevis TaxID=244447 RepID=UPI000D62FF60|nr:oocyte zinc finger protein XlCOF6-like [Cynoglossus semilaevis]
MDVQPTNLRQLCDAIMSIWTKLSEECFQHLVESMPRRIEAVLKAKGVYIKQEETEVIAVIVKSEEEEEVEPESTKLHPQCLSESESPKGDSRKCCKEKSVDHDDSLKKTSEDRLKKFKIKIKGNIGKNLSFPERGKKCVLKSDLLKHGNAYLGEKPFTCTICGKGFNSETHVRRHERIHTGEKPFRCSLCGKQFREKGSLRTHERIHTGEKPFGCSFCGEKFTEKGGLTKDLHQRLHTREKPLICAFCGKHLLRKLV